VTVVINTCGDVDSGGSDSDDHSKRVAAVNSLEKEKPRPNQSTTFLNIEGS
jgi:hypothetical protein